MTRIISLNDIDELSNFAADIITESIYKLLPKKDRVVLAIPGGRSVVKVFNHLKEKNIPWRKLHIFMIDERLVPIDDLESNFKLAEDYFIGGLMAKGLLPRENIHPFITKKPDIRVANYETELKRYGGIYDIVLLSSGEDCHVAALYPDHHSIRDDSDFFLLMNDSPKLPKDRMSASRKLLMKSEVAILLFLGEMKRRAYRKFQDDSIDIDSCPAKLVLSIKDSYVLTNFNVKGL